MARLLFTVWPFAGHVHPALAIGHALRLRGHEVAFYTGEAVRSLLEAEGFRCFPFARVDEKRVFALASSEFPYRSSIWQQLRYAKQLQANFREWLLDTVPQQVEDLDTILTHWRPDVLICDLAFWSPILVLGETRGIPVAVLSVLAACLLPGPDAPAWGQGAPRPRNRIMRLRSTMKRKLLQWLSAGFLAQANGIRRRYGLPALRCSVTEFAGRMPLYLVPSMREYDYDRRDLPPSVHYVGPCLWDKPSAAPPPDWLLRLPAGRPLIYATEATIGTGEPFLLQAAARAFRNLPVDVVMTTGAQRNPAGLKLADSAPNVRVESYVPQSDLLPRTAVMVTLGGSGGVLAALKAGVPLVVVPTEWDRPENAQRVVEAGAGIRIPPNRCTPERLRSAVERILREPSYRANAQRLAAVSAHYSGPDRASELLEGLCTTAAAMPGSYGGNYRCHGF
uniref:Glycosyltransferase, MGT family n=1 Tax=Solibacter usitatus (strain Ellin6076) TaxID=234267 RepID=Q026U9_SOLUE